MRVLVVQPVVSAFSLIVKFIESELGLALHLTLEASGVQGQQPGVSALDLAQLCNHLLRLLFMLLYSQCDLGLH